jgi:hypothetical protein
MTEPYCDHPVGRSPKQSGSSMLRMIYGVIATLAGCIQVYMHLSPETPAEQLAPAVDALGSGQDSGRPSSIREACCE